MKVAMKSIALAALAVAAGSAMAQENTVSVYGRANVTAESQKVGSTSGTALVDNQSRVGVRANRGLGDGLSAGITLEAGLNVTNGTTRTDSFFAREATVNVGSDSFGRVKLGRLPASTAYFATADYVSNHNHDTGSTADALYDGQATGALKNAISYTSPKIGGLVLEGQYGFKKGVGLNNSGSTALDTNTVSPQSYSANFSEGPLAIGLAHERGDNTFSSATGDYMNTTGARAFYTMGPIGFGGYVQKSTGTNAGRTAYRLSAMYTEGKGEFHVNYGSAGNRAGVANTGASQFTLGYNYNLDKQTKIYAFTSRVNNQSAASYSPGRFIASPTNGQDLSTTGVGLRYNF